MKAGFRDKKTKSIHIFSWGFRLGTEKDKLRKTLEKLDFERVDFLSCDFGESLDEYQREQYFSNKFNSIFVREKGQDALCDIYELKLNDGKPAEYRFTVRDGSYLTDYVLDIEKIELHVYEYEVGNLFIYCTNRHYGSKADFLRINDFGRHISVPFIPKDRENGELLCAERAVLQYNDIVCERNYREEIKSVTTPEELCAFQEKDSIPQMILSGGGTVETPIPDKAYLFSEDRMHLISVIKSNVLSDEIRLHPEDKGTETDLYMFAYVNGRSVTCQNRKMLQDALEETLYKRWSDFGTIHTVTDNAFICITREDESLTDPVVLPIVTQIPYMYSVVYAQRLILEIMSQRAADLISVKKRKRKHVFALQESYIKFLNRMMLTEVTSQTQGTELYDLMQKHHRIVRRDERVRAQLSEFNGMELNKRDFRLTIAAIAIAVVTFIVTCVSVVLPVIENYF